MITPFIKTNIEVVNKKTHTPTEYDFYIGRPSVLGNPYTHLKSSKASKYLVPTRDKAIELYEPYFYDRLEDGEFHDELNKIIELYKEHKKINLICWCKPKSCHGDYIKSYLEKVLRDEEIL